MTDVVEYGPLFPAGAIGVRVTWVEQPGGPVDPRVTPYVREILEELTEPVLHVVITTPGGPRFSLIGMGALRRRGLPETYEELSALYPQIEWSAR